MQLIDLNTGDKPILAATAARRVGVARTAIVSAIHGGHVTGARKIDGCWHLEPGAVWRRWPAGRAGHRTAKPNSTEHTPHHTGETL